MIRRASLSVLVSIAAFSQAADPLPTADQIQASYDAKDWQGVLGATTRTLQLKGAAAQPYDRVDLWTKKAEAQLRLNQFAPASQSMAKVADEKTATPEQKDNAVALSVLFRKTDAKGFRSSAKIGAVKTFDVLDPTARKEALAVLFEAGYTDVSQQVDRAKASTDGRNLAALARSVGELRAMDRVVNKSNEKSDGLEKALGGNFADLAKKWAEPVTKRCDELLSLANENVVDRYNDGRGNILTTTRNRGNTTQEQGEAKKFMDEAKRLATAYATLEAALGDVGKAAIKPTVDAVDPAFKKAKQIVETTARPVSR